MYSSEHPASYLPPPSGRHGYASSGPASSVSAVDESSPALILVVDDEPNIVDFLSLLLEDEGYRVRQALNGREALSVIREEPPQLVISDVMMPGINGVELLRQIDASEQQHQPKVILMSAVAHRVPQSGVPFIQKPFDVNDMLTMVDGLLDDGTPRSA
jgi:DNA-binding response OmpR family regulator